MGGKKKLNLKQMERMQDKKDEEDKSKDKDKKKKEKTGAPKEKKPLSILAPEINDKTVGEIKKMHVLTPFSVASRFGIRMSVARSFLFSTGISCEPKHWLVTRISASNRFLGLTFKKKLLWLHYNPARQ